MSTSFKSAMERLKCNIRDVPDFPKKGINFCDILPIFADLAVLHIAIDALEAALLGVDFDKIVGL